MILNHSLGAWAAPLLSLMVLMQLISGHKFQLIWFRWEK